MEAFNELWSACGRNKNSSGIVSRRNKRFCHLFKAQNKITKEIVALKFVRKFSISDGLPFSFYRELKALQAFQSFPNIIQYKDIAQIFNPETNDIDLFIVLEYANYDLSSNTAHWCCVLWSGWSQFDHSDWGQWLYLQISFIPVLALLVAICIT